MPLARKTLSAAIALSWLASGCVYYPTVTAHNEPKCDMYRYQLELEMKYLGDGPTNPCGSLRADDCLVGWAVLAGLTFVTSESIVLVGNSALWVEKQGEVYWLERQGRCGDQPVTQASGPLSLGR